MSLDYPNREAWLARRYTPSRPRRGYVIYAFGPPIVRGRNAEKARVGKGWDRMPIFGETRSVKNKTLKRTQQLADRRLRQRLQRPSF